MEKRVIKFNLVGAISILILSLIVIIGSIVAIPKLINKTKDGNSNIKKLGDKTSEVIDENQEFKEKVIYKSVEGTGEQTEREISMKYFVSKMGYHIKFSPEYFYSTNDSQFFDRFYSLYSNTIGIEIEKKSGSFNDAIRLLDEEKSRYLIENPQKYTLNPNDIQTTQEEQTNLMQRKVGEAYVDEININGRRACKRLMVSNDSTEIVYCVYNNDNSYYYINTFCSKSFEDEIIPVIEHMIQSFTIDKE